MESENFTTSRLSQVEKEVKKIEQRVVKAMTELTVYRDEFLPVIHRYASVQWEYNSVYRQWIEDGCIVTCERKSSNGVVSEGLDLRYKAMKSLREELTLLESQLGLTPNGIKKIKDEQLKKQKEESRFERGLNALLGNNMEETNERRKGKNK